MKILYVTQNFPPEPGTGLRLLKHAVWMQKLGHKLTFLTTMPYYPMGRIFNGYRGRLVIREKIENVDVIRVWSFPAPNKGVVRRVLSQTSFAVATVITGMLLERYDLIIATVPTLATEAACLLIARLKKSKVLLELEDLIPDNLALLGFRKESLVSRALSAYFRLIYRWVDLIAVLSENMALALMQRGVTLNRILMLPNAADSEVLDAGNGKHMRQQLRIDDKFVAVYAGSFCRHYQVPNMVSAVCQLEKCLPQVHLLLVGTGPDRETVEKMINERTQNNVTILGPVAPDETAAYLQAANLFIYSLAGKPTPEAYQHLISAKLAEYLMVGRPVISVESGPICGDRLKEIDAGFSVSADQPQALADAIAFFATHPSETMRCADNARKFAEANLKRRKIVEEFESQLVRKLRDMGINPQQNLRSPNNVTAANRFIKQRQSRDIKEEP